MSVVLPFKPKFGTACNGCGICCSMVICPIGRITFPYAVAPCPALQIAEDKTRTFCGLVVAEKQFKLEPVIETMLGINQGCDTSDDYLTP